MVRTYWGAFLALVLFCGCGSSVSSKGGTSAASPGRETGKLKWYNSEIDFGFIIPETGGKDLIFNHGGIKDLKEGMRVEFERITDDKGEKAIKIKALE